MKAGVVSTRINYNRITSTWNLCAQMASKAVMASKADKANADFAGNRPAFRADRNLAQRIVGGDEQGFIRLIEDYKLVVTRVVSRFVNHQADRDEIVNETFAEVYFSLAKFRGDSTLQTWISTIATRLCYKYLKRRDREKTRRQLLKRIGWGTETTRANDELERAHSAREQLELMMKMLAPADRMVLTLLYWEGCSVKEAAGRLGWTESNVKVRAHRAREKIKSLFGDEIHE